MIRSLVATLVSATFAFQMLGAEGVACVTSGSAEDVTMAAMLGMDAALAMTPPPASQGATQEDYPHHAPCDQPTVPASCQLMAPCAVSFIVVTAAASDTEWQVSTRVVPTRALEPSSRTDPPEFPPPRA
jgi:hypothetical protein